MNETSLVKIQVWILLLTINVAFIISTSNVTIAGKKILCKEEIPALDRCGITFDEIMYIAANV